MCYLWPVVGGAIADMMGKGVMHHPEFILYDTSQTLGHKHWPTHTQNIAMQLCFFTLPNSGIPLLKRIKVTVT